MPEEETGRPILDEAPEPQPEHEEPRLAEPGATDLSKSGDYVAIVKRAAKESVKDHITNLAAALAYYAFLAIPSVLLVAVGLFSLLATPDTVSSLVDQLAKVMPAEVVDLVEQSLTNMTQKSAQGAILVGIGGLLALWSTGGAMQNLDVGWNAAYDREETRGFVKRRLTAYVMFVFVFIGFGLAFGLLVLGPQLSEWLGNAARGADALQEVGGGSRSGRS